MLQLGVEHAEVNTFYYQEYNNKKDTDFLNSFQILQALIYTFLPKNTLETLQSNINIFLPYKHPCKFIMRALLENSTSRYVANL